MSKAQDILQHVQIEPAYEALADRAGFDEKLGFIVVPQESVPTTPVAKGLARIGLIGFGVPAWQIGEDRLDREWTPITKLHDLPEHTQTLGRYSKGVGPRLYNTPQALAGAAENPSAVGAYLFDINPDKVYDARTANESSTAGRLRRVGSHFSKIVASKLAGLDSVVAALHEQFGDADGVLYNQTVSAELKEAQRHQEGSAVDERFLIIRNSSITLTRVGEYRRI